MTTEQPDHRTRRDLGPGPPETPDPTSPDASRPDASRPDPTSPEAAGGDLGGRAPQHPPPVIRDRRKVRVTGQHTDPGQRPGAGPDQTAGGTADPAGETGPAVEATTPLAGETTTGGLGAELATLRTALEERTRDLQRITAEYANYRKRVERDRALVNEQATAHVLSALLPVLDDLDRAREHGELVEGVAAVAEQLVATTSKFGLTPFGERGDPFDPNRHEAVAHLTSTEVTEPTCVDVLRRGYLLGDRLLRPAMVAVADPAPAEPAESAGPGGPDQPDQPSER